MSITDHESEQAAEIERLRARVAELEEELVEVQAWANRTVGLAQERVYWLDRWHIDLNALMKRRGASELRATVRAVRWVYRRLRRLTPQVRRAK
jgi:hypothetical protein